MNGLEIFMFVAGISAGMFIGFFENLRKINKAIDAALEVVKEKDDTIQSLHEKTGWLDCLSFLLKSYR
ncbi:hypothetical protein [Candidatus Enterococcus ikei]|uniref:Uncharacterized protein n=1 Tax=Candidatus Enterococcus ikei TaxID=2815326 RepID=A0ABS3GWV6_9ENTE|nr:hypothetical protein [Enterococcus sp. DIV0869a]MBO0438954.1 hypothetical protein [Enterococcus sp. DIV0869a]